MNDRVASFFRALAALAAMLLAAPVLAVCINPNPNPAQKVIGDFDHDCKSDLFWRNAVTGQTVLWRMNGAGIASAGSPTTVADLNWVVQGVGDFDGDGMADVFWKNVSSGQTVLWQMNGSVIANSSSPATVSDLSWQVQGIGDFDNDGKSDVLWKNAFTGQVVVWLMNGAVMTTSASPTTVADLAWQVEGIGDFDNDGKSDVLWRNMSTGQTVVWLMNGTAITSSASPGTVGDLNWRVQGVGDLDGDGKADVLWKHSATGQVVVWRMNGASIASSTSPNTVSDLNWRVQGIGDYNDDGRADVLWMNAATGQTVVWLMNSLAGITSASGVTGVPANWEVSPVKLPPPALAGSVPFNGPYPALSSVTYKAKNGTLITLQAYPGLVVVLVTASSSPTLVRSAVQSAGGSLVGMTPGAGIYIARVTPGQEVNFLTAMYVNAWVEEGFALFPSVRGLAAVLDANVSGNDPCDAGHGSSVAAIASRRGATDFWNIGTATGPAPWDMVRMAYSRWGATASAGTPVVVNLSWQAAAAQGSASVNWNFCTSVDCDAARYGELAFLAGQMKVIEESLKDPTSPANRMLFTVITGNFGVELDSQIALLKSHYPNAFGRVVLVGGSDAAGNVFNGENHLIDNSLKNGTNDVVYALGVNAPVSGSTTCTGTSFAAPEVASVLDYIWRSKPTLNAAQVVSAFKQALAEQGTNGVIPKDASGYTTAAFLARGVQLVGGTAPNSFTLALSTAGTGGGTVSASPPGPNYAAGTSVTLTATANPGSVFAGWSGSCPGACQMNANKTAVATFNLQPVGPQPVVYVGTASGSSTLSSPWPAECAPNPSITTGSVAPYTVQMTLAPDFFVPGPVSADTVVGPSTITTVTPTEVCTYPPPVGAITTPGQTTTTPFAGGGAVLTGTSNGATVVFDFPPVAGCSGTMTGTLSGPAPVTGLVQLTIHESVTCITGNSTGVSNITYLLTRQ